MSKPGKVLKKICKRLGVRLTVKRGKKRVKSVKVKHNVLKKEKRLLREREGLELKELWNRVTHQKNYLKY